MPHSEKPAIFERIEGRADQYRLEYQIVDAGKVIGVTHFEGSISSIITKLVGAHRSATRALERCKSQREQERAGRGQ